MTATTINAGVQQDLRALLQRFIDDVINAQDLDEALVAIVAEDFVELNPLPGQGPGRGGLADVLGMMFVGFPDLRWTIHDTLVEGNRVMGFSTWTGTHHGDFMGIPATGRTATVEAWTLDRYRDSIFVESRMIMDVAGLLGQLGVLPGPRIRLTVPAGSGISGIELLTKVVGGGCSSCAHSVFGRDLILGSTH